MSKTRPKLSGIFSDAEAAANATIAPLSSDRPDRVGRAALPFWTTTTAKKQLRLLAAEEETTQQALLTEALNDLFRKHGRPPVA
jgi:hypothetical protein